MQLYCQEIKLRTFSCGCITALSTGKKTPGNGQPSRSPDTDVGPYDSFSFKFCNALGGQYFAKPRLRISQGHLWSVRMTAKTEVLGSLDVTALECVIMYDSHLK